MKRRRLSSPPSSSSVSAEIIGGHDDLLLEILLRLPPKSLLRFKSVSKNWNSLISDESFHRRHLLRRRPDTQHSFILGAQGRSQYFICHPTVNKLVRFNLPCNFPFVHEYVNILQSCHGLLLLDCAYYKRGTRYYYVLNPTTNKFRNIYNGDAAVALSLIFDPSKSENYRVLGIWKNAQTNCAVFSMYVPDTGKWTSGGDLPLSIKFTKVVSCNNRAYFISNNHACLYYSHDGMGGVFPRVMDKSRYVVESNGHLHCVRLSFNHRRPSFCISELIGNEWSVGKRTVWRQIKRVLEEQRRSTRSQIEFLGMIREERMEDSMFVVHVPGQIVISRLRDEVCEVLVDYKNDMFYQEGRLQFEFKNAHPFIESFASV